MRSWKHIKPFVLLMALPLFVLAGVALAQPRHRTLTVPFHVKHSLILLEAEINDKPRMLILDTGAQSTIVDVSALGSVQRFDLEHAHVNGNTAGSHGETEASTVDLKLGEKKWSDRVVGVMNLSEVSKRFGVPIDGLLGQDVLQEFSAIRIDYKKHVVELELDR